MKPVGKNPFQNLKLNLVDHSGKSEISLLNLFTVMLPFYQTPDPNWGSV